MKKEAFICVITLLLYGKSFEDDKLFLLEYSKVMLNLHQTSKMTQYKVYSLHCHPFTCLFFYRELCVLNQLHIILDEDREFQNVALQCRLLQISSTFVVFGPIC